MRISILFAGLLLALVPLLRSQDKPAPAPTPAPAPATAPQDPMVAAMEAAAAPTEHHKALARFEGDWTVKGKFFMDPSKPPMETKGKSEFKMLFDGRFLREKYESKFMGKDFEGLGLIGYDKNKKAYIGNWVDTMTTSFALSEGAPAADANTLELKGSLVDPVSGETVQFRWVRTWKDADSFVFTSIESRGGKPEVTTMEMTYKRKPAKPEKAEKPAK